MEQAQITAGEGARFAGGLIVALLCFGVNIAEIVSNRRIAPHIFTEDR
jgi:hypothetical protein